MFTKSMNYFKMMYYCLKGLLIRHILFIYLFIYSAYKLYTPFAFLKAKAEIREATVLELLYAFSRTVRVVVLSYTVLSQNC